MAVQCPECGTYNITSAETCKKCGAELKASLSKIESSKTQKPGFFSRLFGKGKTRSQ